MPDKRSVDDLSIEELERVLAIKKRQARMEQMQRMQRQGRVVAAGEPVAHTPVPPVTTHPANNSDAPQFEDGLEQSGYKRKNQDNRIWRRFVDRSLLMVEAVAVIGLVFLGVQMVQGIAKLQSETANAQQMADEQIRASIPTIAPTPVLQLANIVLPGGHIPPTMPGGGEFNYEEIPASLRAQVRSEIVLAMNIPRAPTTPETARRIVIPEIGVDHVIVQGTDPEALKLGVGQELNGVNPSSNGNLVLAAHNDIYGEIFRYLDQLEPGMVFEVHTEKQIYNYVITGHAIVDPDEVSVMANQGRPTATLISCYPYQVNNKRYIIFADRAET